MIELRLEYTFSTTAVPPPTGNQLRLDAATGVLATRVFVTFTGNDGVDAYYLLAKIAGGLELVVQDKNDHTRALKFLTTGPAIDRGTYFELPVASGLAGDAGAPTNNQTVLLVLLEAGAPATAPGAGGADLVAFATAKDHLRITDTAHDLEIQSKLAQASAAIRDYLKDRVDLTWTANTAPLPVQAATLYLLAQLYEHRGEDLAPDDFDAAAWGAVDRLLKRFRDPTLA